MAVKMVKRLQDDLARHAADLAPLLSQDTMRGGAGSVGAGSSGYGMHDMISDEADNIGDGDDSEGANISGGGDKESKKVGPGPGRAGGGWMWAVGSVTWPSI